MNVNDMQYQLHRASIFWASKRVDERIGESIMAQIFISHSQRDRHLVDFFLRAFAGTKVKPLFQELEKEPVSGITEKEITRNIEASNAVFVLLSECVQALAHTGYWVAWECGTAKNKDIWIFEPFEAGFRVRVVIPRFNHFVRFNQNEDWRRYIRGVIDSYDDSHVLTALSAGAGIGAVLDEKDRGRGAAKGFLVGIGGLILHSINKPSFGYPVRCLKCHSNFSVHLPDGVEEFRCANCNADLALPSPPQTARSFQNLNHTRLNQSGSLFS